MGATCPGDNLNVIDQSKFWDENGAHWDKHRIGWAVAGTAAAIVRPSAATALYLLKLAGRP